MKNIIETVLLPLFAVVALAVSSVAFAESEQGWKYVESVDAFTDKVTRQAIIRSEEGHSLVLTAPEVLHTWMFLHLKPRELFSDSWKELLVRVDKHETIKYSSDKNNVGTGTGLLESTWKWNSGTIGVMVSSYGRSSPNLMCQIMTNGKIMRVRYYSPGGSGRDIVFDISKNKEAIRKAMHGRKEWCKNE